MYIALDMGNTRTVIGLFDERAVRSIGRIPTKEVKDAGRAAETIELILEEAGYGGDEVDGSIVSSVVPERLSLLVDAMRVIHTMEPLVAGPDLELGLRIGYSRPEELGSDRIADAVAGYEEARGAVIVVDFGTATTFNAVTADGVFLGGAISPGVITAGSGLTERAARLFDTGLEFPESAIGRSTDEGIRSGLLWGAVSLVDGMVDRIRNEMGGAHVIGTGGLAQAIVPRSRTIRQWDADLTLKGLKLLYERNR